MSESTHAAWVEAIHQGVEKNLVSIQKVNEQIHSQPELSYHEHRAHENLAALLETLGFAVTRHAYGLDTAFAADYGSGGRLVVFNAEYDALPGIGHACGHNLIAASSLTAFLGAAAVLAAAAASKEGGGIPGRVRLLGTPAEEDGGGKVRLIERGAYGDVAACLMAHPGPRHPLRAPCTGVAAVSTLASVAWTVGFRGRAAHAAMEPWSGLNALDAVCLAYGAVSMLRQQVRPVERIHGVVRRGGERPNVIPADASVEYYVRSDTRANADRLWDRVKRCFDGAAVATGCEVGYEAGVAYADLRPCAPLCEAFVEAMPRGAVALDTPSDALAGSTDMGNVTYECPGFHGYFGIDAEPGQGNHTEAFAAAAGLPGSLDRAVEWGKGMAFVACRVLLDDDFNRTVQEKWKEDIEGAK